MIFGPNFDLQNVQKYFFQKKNYVFSKDRFSSCTSIWDRCWCRFGLPNGSPGVRAASKTVPGSSWFGSFFVLSFGIAFWVVLGSFWGRFWPLRGSFWCFFGSSTRRFNPSTHQLVDSTHQLINPWPFGTFLPGPADCALRD